MIWIQALIILACIMLGARKSGVAMGFAGGVGLFILVFVFGLKSGFSACQRSAYHHRSLFHGGDASGRRRVGFARPSCRKSSSESP